MKIKMQTFSFYIFKPYKIVLSNIMKRKRSRKGAPGIVEVAARAGVCPSTVSRTFNEPEIVRAKTRLKIETAAKELGYIRDRMAGALHNRFSGTIGLIVPTIDNAIFSELIEAFSHQLQSHDRTMLIAAHGYDLNQEVAIVRSLLERRIDGIVLIGLDHENVSLNMLAQRDVPVISIWNYYEKADLPCIGSDNFEAGALVTDHILSLGHTDIAFMFPPTYGNDRARDRKSGAIHQMEKSGLPIPQTRLMDCAYDIGLAKSMAITMLEHCPPTAIICGNDIIAHGVIYACQSKNMKIPDELSIVGIGDFRGSAFIEPALTTVRLPAKRIGKIAADTIVSLSETGINPDPYNYKVALTLINRSSTAHVTRRMKGGD